MAGGSGHEPRGVHGIILIGAASPARFGLLTLVVDQCEPVLSEIEGRVVVPSTEFTLSVAEQAQDEWADACFMAGRL